MKAPFFIALLCFARYLRYGLSSNAVQRVINGIDTNIKYHPYMVSLVANGRHMCGGAIINNGWVLTSAQCIKRVKDPLKEITLRSSCSTRNDENCVSYNVSNFYVHEKFNSENIDYDIAVIQVIPQITYDDRTKAIDLPPDGDVREEWGTVCGWGFYSKTKKGKVNKILSKNLKCATVPRVDNKQCQEDYEEIIGGDQFLSPRMECYGYKEGETDFCYGDSGGPLVNIENILLGITSWGYCAEYGLPGVYTDVKLPELKQWIKEKTGMD